MSPRVKAAFNALLVLVICGGLVVMLGLRFFSYNALAVFLDDLHVGYIALSQELTSEEFHDDVIAHLRATYLTDVVVSQRVTIEPARRVSTRNINRDRSNMISQLGRNMNVMVVARAIYVNNNLEVLVRSENCVLQIENILRTAWETPYTIESTFTANWRTEPIVVPPDDERIRTPREAIYAMDRPEIVYHRHVVQSGESLYLLARLYNTTMHDLAALNDRTTAQPLLIGEVIVVRTRRPLLSVQTVDEVTTYLPIEIPVDVRYSPNRDMATRVIIQEGVVGEQRIAQRVVRINGVVISTETLDAEVIREPITEITEIGTRPTEIVRR